MKMENVKFLWASEEINKRADEYWLTVMDVATRNTFARIKKYHYIIKIVFFIKY